MNRESLPGFTDKILHRYEPGQINALVTTWLKVFGQHRQGINTGAYLWHIFSAGRYPSIAGKAALQRYRQQLALETIVLSNDCKEAFSISGLPENCPMSDYLVFPPNLAWTMAFTHEDGWLGPYFAYHADYEKLNAVNLELLRKQKQKAHQTDIAKRNGWM